MKRTLLSVGIIGLLSLGGCTTSSTSGYLESTEKSISAEQAKAGVSKLIFLRPEAKDGTIPTIFVNEQVVGSLAPNRYAQTWVCPGEQTIRVGTRAQAIRFGAGIRAQIQPNGTYYVHISETADHQFDVQLLDPQQGQQINQSLKRSHILDRQVPVCNNASN